MPQKVWAVGEEVLAADFNPYVQAQVVAQFANAAQRDSQWTAPPAGALCVTVDNGIMYQRIGTTWYTPFRRIGLAQRTTNGPASAAESIVLTISSVVVPAGRLLRVSAGWRASVGVAGSYLIAQLREGTTTAGTLLADLNSNMMPSGAQVSSDGGRVMSYDYPSGSTAATKSWVLTSQGPAGTPTPQMLGQATSPIWLAVDDLGGG